MNDRKFNFCMGLCNQEGLNELSRNRYIARGK
jgi:hypothetical protein